MIIVKADGNVRNIQQVPDGTPIPAGWVEYDGDPLWTDDEGNWVFVPIPDPPYIRPPTFAEQKAAAAKTKRLEVKAWASQLNSRAYETTLPDAVDNMLTQDVRQGDRAQINGNTQEINSALNAAFANAITTIETARDDPVIDLNANVIKGVNVVLDGLNTLSDILGSVLVSNAESKGYFKTRPRFHLILMGGEARGLMKQEINAIRDDPQSTVQDILDYAVDDTNAGAVHAAAYPTESPTLAERLAEYPADYED